MPTTLATEGFGLSRLPVAQEIDPRRFAFDPQLIASAVEFAPTLQRDLAQVGDQRFELGTRRATRESRRNLDIAKARAAEDDYAGQRAAEVARTAAEQAAAELSGYRAGDTLTTEQTNADLRAQTAMQDAINAARKSGEQADEERRARARQDAADKRAEEASSALAQSRVMSAEAATKRADNDAAKAEMDQRYKEALIRDADARARTRGGRVVDSQPVKFPDGTEAMVLYVQTIGEDGKPVIQSEFHELPQGGAFTRPQQNRPNLSINLGGGAATVSETPPPAPTSAAPTAPVAPSTSADALPVYTPEQARRLPPGTRFRTTDGRVLVSRAAAN